MSFSFHVPHGSAPPPECPTPSQDVIFKNTGHAPLSSTSEAAIRAANNVLSGASEHARHPDPRSGLLESHIFPVIYTKYHFEDLKFGYLRYSKEMIKKHRVKGIVLSEGDIATYWVIQIRREYPNGHPRRRILMEQMGHYDVQVFWEHKSQKAIQALETEVDTLNKQVKLLNEELARVNQEAQKPVKANPNDDAHGVSDSLPKPTTYEPGSEQYLKRKRTGSTGEGNIGGDKYRPFPLREADVVTEQRKYHKCRPADSDLPLRLLDHNKEDQMHDDD